MQENPLRPVIQRFPKLGKDEKTEVLVVGGGITGVSCAYFLQEAGYDVVVIEMDEVGSGASGASSGILYYGTGSNFIPSAELWGKKTAELVWKETGKANNQLVKLIEKNSIDCGLRKIGAIMAADSQHLELLQKEQKELSKIGLSHKILDTNEIKQFYNGASFQAGLHFHKCTQLYPALFAAGLAKEAGLRLYEHTKLIDCASGVAKTDSFKINYDKIVFATNDFPVPKFKSNFSQVSSVIAASQITDTTKFFPEEKILWTMGDSYDIVYPHEKRMILEVFNFKDLKDKLFVYYPGLSFSVEHQWGSTWGRTQDWLPIAGKISKNVFAAIATSDQGSTVGFAIATKIKNMVENKNDNFLKLTDPKRFLEN